MIREVPMYTVDCDRCEVNADESTDYAAWAERGQAVDLAIDAEWLCTDDGHHYCPACTEWDADEDNQIPKPSLPVGAS